MTPGTHASRLHRKVGHVLALDGLDCDRLDALQHRRESVAANTLLWRQGDRLRFGHIVIDGWALAYTELPSGSRQVINLRLPGDIIGLFAPVRSRSWYSVRAITPLRVATLPPNSILELFRESPRLAGALSWSAAYDDLLLCEQIVRLGRRSAHARVAHLLVELYLRCRLVGLTESRSFHLPLSQELIADTLGLSAVHTHRMLHRLCAERVISISRSRVRIEDLDRLATIADFDMQAFSCDPLPKAIQHLA